MKKQILIHLRMMRASTKTMLTNLKDIADEETINELLDTLNKLDAEIKDLEEQLKNEGE
ncbi:formiminotetrahydrofolate cyclodeaminase [Arcicella rosea]|uniref:hypothetical protein n=1 Tax=Arcicella rosea TaxID=502909 RepID=UPI00345CD273